MTIPFEKFHEPGSGKIVRRFTVVGREFKDVGVYLKCLPGDIYQFTRCNWIDCDGREEAHMLQFNGLGGEAGDEPAVCPIQVRVDQCRFVSGRGIVEDMLSFISVQGSKARPLLVRRCVFSGPTRETGTGLIADRACDWLLAQDNRFTDTTNWAAAIAGGSHNRFERNVVKTQSGGGIYCNGFCYPDDPFVGNVVVRSGKNRNRVQAPEPYWFG